MISVPGRRALIGQPRRGPRREEYLPLPVERFLGRCPGCRARPALNDYDSARNIVLCPCGVSFRPEGHR